MTAFKITSPYSGAYEIIDTNDGERVARVNQWMPGPMVSVTGSQLMSPALARAVAEAMLMVARDIETESAHV